MADRSFKRDLLGSLAWIALYLALVALANVASDALGAPDSMNALLEVLFPVAVTLHLRRRGLLRRYGLVSLRGLDYRGLLYLAPMVFISLVNLGFGIHVNYPWQQTALIVIAMLGVGFSEEILFRGFLMQALMAKGAEVAIVVPSLAFGLIHYVNLLGGADVVTTTLQALYAVSFALMCSMFVYRTGNIIPCMLCHGITDVTGIFMPGAMPFEYQCLGCVAMIVPSLFYAWYLYKTKRPLVGVL